MDPNQQPTPHQPEQPAAPQPQTDNHAFGQPQQQPQSQVQSTESQSVNSQPQAPSAPASQDNPGQLLGILSIVAPFVGFAVVGIVLGVISRNKSKSANQSTTLGTVGLVISIISTVLGLLAFALFFIGIIAAGSQSDANLNDSSFDSSYQQN